MRIFLNKQKLSTFTYHYVFFIQKLVNNNLFKNNHDNFLWNVLQVIGFQNSSGVFESCDGLRLGKFYRYQSTRVYFQGKAFIKIILKNQARSYYRGGLVIAETRYLHQDSFC